MRILTGRSLWRALCWFLGLIFVLMTSFSVAPRAGFSVSADEGASPLVASSPILGGWTTYRSDDVDNLASAIAYNSLRGEYLVVWEDHYAAEVAIYARRVDSKGVALGGAIQVAHYSTYPSLQPDIAYSPVQDKYLVVYYQDSKPSLPPNVDYNIIGQPINGDGTKTETGFLIGGNTNNQRHPAVAYNADDDEFLVVWDEEQGEGGWKDIWAQRINALDWSSEPGPVCIATGGSKDRTEPDAAYNGTRGQYMIAYTRWEGDGDIFAKVLNSNLPDPLSITEIDIVYNTNLQGDVALAAGPDEYMVIWQDGPGISWRTIYARRVTGAGHGPWRGRGVRLDGTRSFGGSAMAWKIYDARVEMVQRRSHFSAPPRQVNDGP